MKCLLCERFSWRVLCNSCLRWLAITPQKRDLGGGFYVYSFYDYDEVKACLYSKYSIVGSKIFSILAHRAAAYLKKEVTDFASLLPAGIGLDDTPKGGYSHVAILLHAFKSSGIRPFFGLLKAANREVIYAGKSLEYRQNHPRGFYLDRPFKEGAVVLIDDVITTGTTMMEAKRILEAHGARVLCGLTLSDARGIVA